MSEEKRIAQLLNDAGKCGIRDDEMLRSFIAEYFCDPADTDCSDDEEDVSFAESESETDSEVDENIGHDSTFNKTTHSVLTRATEMFDFEYRDDKESKCKCQIFEGEQCIKQFTEEECISIRLNITELTSYEKDLLLLGMIAASCNDSDNTLSTKQKNSARKQTRIREFRYGYRRICRDAFLHLMCISKDKLTALKKHYVEHGLIPRKKQSGGRQKTALSFDEIRLVSSFIQNYAEQHALVLPGRIPGFKRDDVQILPSSNTKASIWRLYRSSLADDDRQVSLVTFRSLWRQLFPYVVLAKPMTDLCWVCQRNNTHIIRSVNINEEEKTDVLRQQEEHLRLATLERSHYNALVVQSTTVAEQHKLTILKKSKPQSLNAAFHYSFDFAQQVQYPSDPMQPGPIYFKVPRRCGIFGVNAEGLKQQINYLIDEGCSVGKGANTVISLIHHFFENYGLGETDLQLQADNCAGQNKNSAMMWYLSWRVTTGLHNSASISFMLSGHTKFAPDWCFGLLKRLYRRTKVSSLEEISHVVENSSQKGVNKPQLVGNEKGEVFVPVYDWVSFLSQHCKRLTGIKKMHHISFKSSQPGMAFVKHHADTEEQAVKIGPAVFPREMPCMIPPPGLDRKRQEYLFKEIRPFCTPETADLVCPFPVNIVPASVEWDSPDSNGSKEKDMDRERASRQRRVQIVPGRGRARARIQSRSSIRDRVSHDKAK